MSEEKLRAAIAEIRTQLAHAEGLDETSRRALERLADDLESRLRHPRSSARTESLRRELDDWVRRLEASHSSLATTIENLIDTLAFFNL